MKPNYIFLDIDGVLTAKCETPGSYLNHEISEYGPSPKCVERIKKLCTDTGSKIIISSNWRRFDEEGFWHYRKQIQVKNPLPNVKHLLSEFIVGELTPERHLTKAEAIVLWFEDHGNNCNFVIFDDDKREQLHTTHDYGIAEHFIMTNIETGVSDTDCEKAKKILGVN